LITDIIFIHHNKDKLKIISEDYAADCRG